MEDKLRSSEFDISLENESPISENLIPRMRDEKSIFCMRFEIKINMMKMILIILTIIIYIKFFI